MIFAVSNIAWAPEERLEAYAAMADADVAGLEIAPAMFFPDSADPFRPDRTEVRRATEEIAAAGLRLVSMQSLLFGVEGASLFEEPAARERFLHGMERAIALAGRLGIPNLVFGSPGQRRIPEDLPPARARAEAAQIFFTLGEQAVAAGTAITIEPNPAAYGTNFLNTLAEAEDFVAEVSHPGIRLILDLGAMAMNGEAETTADRVPSLLPILNHVHVSEPHLSPAPASSEALAPVLSALETAGYARAVSIEMKRPARGIEELHHRLAKLGTARR